MKLEFSLDLKKTILLAVCFVLLAIALISGGYLFGFNAGKEYARTKATTSQMAGQSRDGKIVVSQTVTAPEQSPNQTEPLPSGPPPASEDQPDADKPASGDAPADTAPAGAIQPPGTSPATAPGASPAADAPQAADAPADVASQDQPPKPEPPADASAPAEGESAKNDNAPLSPAPEPAKADTSQDKPAPPTTPESPPSGGGDTATQTWPDNYTVQVGSFTIENNAMELIDRLKKMNYQTFMYPYTDSKGRLWYVVQVGEFETQKQAEKKAAEIQQKGVIPLVKPINESIRQKRKSF